MYLPPAFREDRIEVQHDLIRAHPLGLLVTAGPGGLMANPLPFILYPGEGGGMGILRGHFARGNPQGPALAAATECLVVFQGTQDYITPAWYPSKLETGKAVPTWNYAVVHAHGKLRAIDDAAWLRAQIEALTAQHEAPLPHPWAVADAPRDYTEKMISALVGIEIEVTRLEGKWKASQNQPAENQAGIIAALRADGSDNGTAMAGLIAAHVRTADR